MLDFIEQIVAEVKHAQLCAGDITDSELAKRLGMSQSAFSLAKNRGFGIILLHDVANVLGCRVEVKLKKE